MEFVKEPGVIFVIIALVLFYLRLMQLRGRKRKLERKAAVARLNEANRKRGKVGPMPSKNPDRPPYAVTSWILVVISAALMLFGVGIRSSMNFIPLLETYWWVPTSFGILLFMFCFKVEVEA
jgi:hypothetical protein